ncbi:SusC/RagA family TonB-linked outer membrane protein [uncultured Tenacibaculum sp.]|uniref:SusC/RagA family TonB-linked outer membrane protein n=1 Tax=uncultured Tenacibaculum sp. TaxID=174713 RepID=UPI00260C8083|nr:SusC/RagA family TonB-linked outer membrane protein [uncultured Tenacibaculum sp.]
MKTNFNGVLTLILALIVQITLAQERTISGIVSDESGPLPGVNIIKKGTAIGTETDFNGKYTIKAQTGDVLIFSFIGMKTVEINIKSTNKIDLTMVSGNVLNEVVITGLGIKREAKALGYSQQTVKGEDLTKTKETDISTALAGKVAGIQFTGQPSSTFKNSNIRLRGESNVLYVVDGIKLNARSDVNTEDIESMTVLKGLAATAIYGPEGRNGAIVITTKKAKNGESSIEFSTSVAFSNVYLMPEYQNEYGGGYANDGKPVGHPERYTNAIGYFTDYNGQNIPTYSADESWGPKLKGQMVRHWDSWIPGSNEYGKLRAWEANPNNVKDFYQTGVTKNNSLSFLKGGEDYNIRTTLTKIDQELILENTKRSTLTVSVNTDYNINKKLSFRVNANYTNRYTKNDTDNNYGNLGSNFNQWWQRQLDIKRLKNYKQNGDIYSWNISSPTNLKPLYWDSPYFEIYENLNEQVKNSLYGSFGANYKFNDDLNADILFKKSYNSYNYSDRAAWGGLNPNHSGNPWYQESVSSDVKDEVTGIVNYSKKLNDFDFSAYAGFEITNQIYRYSESETVGGMTTPGFYSITTSVDRPGYAGGKIETKRKALFSSLSIGYKDLFFVEGTYRNDWGSTANPDKNKITSFGISSSFVFSKLIENNETLSFGKIRIGLAEAPYFPNPYALSQTYTTGNPYGSTGTSSVPNAGINPLLRGGSKKETEFGIQLKFLKNRIGIDVTYFNRKDEELPSWVTIPGSTGITGFYSNDGKQTTKGFELSLNLIPVKTENFRWDIDFNIASLKKTVNYIADGVDVNILSSWGPQLQERIGKEWGAIYGNAYRRDANGNKILAANGLYEYDTNKFLGSILPDFTGGLTTNFSYKNFNLSFGFDYQFGGKFYGVTRRYSNYGGQGIETVGNNPLGNPIRNTITGTKSTAWSVNLTNANSDSGGQLTSGVDANGNAQQFLVNPYVLWRTNLRNVHEEYINDATYIKLRTIRFEYNLPSTILEKTPFTNINLGIFANNVWLIESDIEGIDPSEIEGRDSYNYIENGQMPSARSIGVNAKFTF